MKTSSTVKTKTISGAARKTLQAIAQVLAVQSPEIARKLLTLSDAEVGELLRQAISPPPELGRQDKVRVGKGTGGRRASQAAK